MAGLLEMDLARVQRWCRARVPEQVRDQVRVEADVAGRLVTVVECRPPWDGGVGEEWTRFPVARLRPAAAKAVPDQSDVQPADDTTRASYAQQDRGLQRRTEAVEGRTSDVGRG